MQHELEDTDKYGVSGSWWDSGCEFGMGEGVMRDLERWLRQIDTQS